ncbi:hypothetical protein [Candidatus Reidiella endopervernicosa]|uniref:Uncharacterized protein n=1 Tax=Candidatus Reidiella endopervernicosa TaxID=2738883 RepID=A0A6N0HVK5_9GAMM|nr:hypothetical protein [Candidatus Reidiella endopervernicosa]QKQ26287.1 hypothetical protein HUE57_08310 [Candidatus Reidiella endopervernicosa]
MISEQESDLTTIDDCWNRIGVWSREESRCPELERYVHCRNCPTFARAGRHVLENRVADDYMREWADIYAQNKQTRAIDNRISTGDLPLRGVVCVANVEKNSGDLSNW